MIELLEPTPVLVLGARPMGGDCSADRQAYMTWAGSVEQYVQAGIALLEI